MDMTELSRANDPGSEQGVGFLPREPRSIADTGLPPDWLNGFVLRHLYRAGDIDLSRLSARMRVPEALLQSVLNRMRSARLVDPVAAPSATGGPCYSLTDAGRSHASEAFARVSYSGPAPVSLEQYRRSLDAQAATDPIHAAGLADALEGLALDGDTLERLGAALSSQRSFVLYGPPGSGRSSIVGRLAALSRGVVWVPHALLAGDQVIRIFDPQVHCTLASERAQDAGPGGDAAPSPAERGITCSLQTPMDWRDAHSSGADALGGRSDARWVACRRPVLVVNNDAGPAAFELRPDSGSFALSAPPQIRAALGSLVIDDAGRGDSSTRSMLARVLPAVQQGVDRLTCPNGAVIELPLRLRVVGVGTRDPAARGYDRLGLRLGHAVPLGPLEERAYRRAVAISAERMGLRCDAIAERHLLDLHRLGGRVPMLASLPNELFGRIVDRARFRNERAELSPDAIDWAWRAMFGDSLRGGAR